MDRGNNDIKSGSRPPDGRGTRPVLTRYERASIVGMRMEQLQRNAIPFVDVGSMGKPDVRAIAMKELEERKLPFVIVRKLPDGRKEVWPLADLLG